MTEGEQARLVAWRLKVLQQVEAEQNVARVCRRFGISGKSFYKWKSPSVRSVHHSDCCRLRPPEAKQRAARVCACRAGYRMF
jgi:hypothetical protein